MGSGNSTSVLGTPRELNQIHLVQHALWALLAFGHFMGLEYFGNTYGGGVGWREVGEPGKAEHPPPHPNDPAFHSDDRTCLPDSQPQSLGLLLVFTCFQFLRISLFCFFAPH